MRLKRWRLLRHRFVTLLTFGALTAAAITLAPAAVGGPMTYLIVTGNSMEPTYHSGDMVMVRASDGFQTGDVAVYQHPQIGQVIHRIIGRDGQSYVFQGDHNGFVDGYRPSRNELVGKAWFAIPRLGSALRAVRQPVALTILTVLSVAGIAGGTSTAAQRRRRRAHARRGAFEHGEGVI